MVSGAVNDTVDNRVSVVSVLMIVSIYVASTVVMTTGVI